MTNPSTQTAFLDIFRSRIKHFADSKCNFNEYFRGKEDPEFYKAAVLVPIFFKEGSLRILLTLRSEQLPSFKGQVAFPGGKQDDCDKDIVATALREAHEEVGLLPDVVEVIAVLSPLVLRVKEKNTYVYPVIGIIESHFDLVRNTSEVQVIFDVPLEFFLLKDTYKRRNMTFKGINFDMHMFDYETSTSAEGQDQSKSSVFVIWGLTAEICLKIAMTGLNKLPEYELNERYSELIQYVRHLDSQKKDLNHSSKI